MTSISSSTMMDQMVKSLPIRAITLLALVLVIGIIKSVWFGRLSHVPGPWYSNFTRFADKIALLKGKRVFYVHELHKRYGPVVRINPNEVSINDIPTFKEIHRAGGPFIKAAFYEKLPTGPPFGVFHTRDVKKHAIRRKLFARSFSKSFLRQNWEPLVRKKVQLVMKRIEEDARKGPVNMMKWWMLLAGDVSTHIFFGESFNTLETGEPGVYNRCAELSLKAFALGEELPLLAFILKLLPLRATREMFAANKILLDYAQLALDNMRQGSVVKENIFSSVYAEMEKGAEGLLTEADVKSEASNFILGGSDTTGTSLTYITWNVLKRPQLQRDLEEELSKLSDAPTDAELEELPLLNAVMFESMRLNGAIPSGLPREVPRGGSFLAGYKLPEGLTVSTQAHSLHREPSAWPNPESFDVDRWIPGKPSTLSDLAKTSYNPFGAGARACQGIHLAQMELRMAIATFFKRFRGAKLAPTMRDSDMEGVDYFVVTPSGARLDVIVPV